MIKEFFADYGFINGCVITVDKSDAIYSAVAVKDNKIIYVGDDKGLDEYIGENTQIIDLKGQTLMPGIVDAHAHFTIISQITGGLVTSVADARCIDDIRNTIKECIRNKKKGEWVFLTNYDESKLAEKRHITHEDIDDISPDNPVWCRRKCFHMSVFNKKAMDMAGIDESMVFDNPDEIGRDANGNLTGRFQEGSNALILNNAKPVHERNALIKAFQKGAELCHKNGITSIHDPGDGVDNYGRNVLQDAIGDGTVKVRAYMSFNALTSREMGLEAARNLLTLGPHSGIGDECYRMGPLKLLLDGSTIAPSAYMKEPFDHDSTIKGIQNFPDQNELNELFRVACKNGFQCTVHAVGDAAVEQILEAYEYAAQSVDVKKLRLRIEHAGFVSPANAERMKKLNVIAVSNPAFIAFNGSFYNKFYGNRMEMMFAHETYRKNDIVECFGSDAPVVDLNPMNSLYSAVTRKTLAGETCGESQKTSILNALRCMTYNGAFASFEDDIKGSIEVGKLADMVVLSENLMHIEADQIKDVKVKMTMLNGEIVYDDIKE